MHSPSVQGVVIYSKLAWVKWYVCYPIYVHKISGVIIFQPKLGCERSCQKCCPWRARRTPWQPSWGAGRGSNPLLYRRWFSATRLKGHRCEQFFESLDFDCVEICKSVDELISAGHVHTKPSIYTLASLRHCKEHVFFEYLFNLHCIHVLGYGSLILPCYARYKNIFICKLTVYCYL